MSLIIDPETHAVMAEVFTKRVLLAKLTREEAVIEIAQEWDFVDKWLWSDSHRRGSFLAYCEEFDLDPQVVRKEVKKARA